VHLLVRVVADDGSDLVISREYISHGLRSRAQDLVSAELGPKPEHEIRSALGREVDAERCTRLDAAINMAADDTDFIDWRPDNPGAGDPEVRRFAVGRLQRLERKGLAATAGPSQWIVGIEPNAPCAISVCEATSSSPCTAFSSNVVRIVVLSTT
jgi:type IV secretory pathway VirD2 relaxase